MLTKTTQNYAARRDLDIAEFTDTFADDRRVVEIADLDQGEAADEYLLAYTYNADGTLRYLGSCFNDDNDAPAHIATDADLRRLIDSIAASR